MPGCAITRCESKDHGGAEMSRTKAERGNQVEGEYESTVYRCPANKWPLELGRNAEGALKNAGFAIIYTDVYGNGGRFYMTARKGAPVRSLGRLRIDHRQTKADGTGHDGQCGRLGQGGQSVRPRERLRHQLRHREIDHPC
jgi:hypothetical protein